MAPKSGYIMNAKPTDAKYQKISDASSFLTVFLSTLQILLFTVLFFINYFNLSKQLEAAGGVLAEFRKRFDFVGEMGKGQAIPPERQPPANIHASASEVLHFYSMCRADLFKKSIAHIWFAIPGNVPQSAIKHLESRLANLDILNKLDLLLEQCTSTSSAPNESAELTLKKSPSVSSPAQREPLRRDGILEAPPQSIPTHGNGQLRPISGLNPRAAEFVPSFPIPIRGELHINEHEVRGSNMLGNGIDMKERKILNEIKENVMENRKV